MRVIVVALVMASSLVSTVSNSAPADKAEDQCYRAFRKKDWKAATSYCLKAAKNGSMNSQFALFRLVQFVLIDPIGPAIKWLKYSASVGNRWSQKTLAVAYAKGRGVQQDFVEAYIWLAISNELDKKRNDASSNEAVNIAKRKLNRLEFERAHAEFKRRLKKVLEARRKICAERDKFTPTCW